MSFLGFPTSHLATEALGCRGTLPRPAVCGSGDPNWGPTAYIANTLPTELSLWPPIHFCQIATKTSPKLHSTHWLIQAGCPLSEMLRIISVSGFRFFFFSFCNICISIMRSYGEQNSSKHEIHAWFIFSYISYIHNLIIILCKNVWNLLCLWKKAWWCGPVHLQHHIIPQNLDFRCSGEGCAACDLREGNVAMVSSPTESHVWHLGHFCLQKSSGFLLLCVSHSHPVSSQPCKGLFRFQVHF